MSDSNPEARTRKPKDVDATDPTSDETLETDSTSEAAADSPVLDDAADTSVADTPVADTPVAEVPVATPLVEPSATPVVAAEPVVPPADEAVTPAASEPVVAPVATQTDPALQTPAQPAPNVVYIEAPQPPRKRGNRAIGSLIAVASAVVFAILYAVILFLMELGIEGSGNFGFLSNEAFWTPVVVFAIGFVILVVVVNRAGWAAYVVGSLLVGVFTYFVTAALILWLNRLQIQPSQAGAFFQVVLTTPAIIIAGFLSREVSLWAGFAIAARGRRVRARNLEAREAYEREFAATRAEYERANAARMDAARADANALAGDSASASVDA